MENEVRVLMKIRESKKHSVRYDPESKDNGVLSGLYLLNDAYARLGRPDVVEVIVKGGGE